MSSFLSYMILGFAICSIFLGYNYYSKNPKNKINRQFLLFCLSSTIWSLGFGFLIIQTSTHNAWLCRSIGMIGVFPYIYFGLVLLGLLSESKTSEQKWLKYTGLFGFIIYPFIIDPSVQSFELTKYGMAYSFIANFWVTLYNIYFVFVCVIIIITLIKFKKKSTLKRKKVTIRTLTLFMVMLIFGTSLDTILPALGFVSFPGSTITQFFGVCLIYSALNYEVKNSTSIENIAQYIFHMSNFPILVFNSNNRLSLVSDSACEFLGISKNDTNVMIEDIFESDTEILDPNNTLKEYKCYLNNSICELSIQKVIDNYGDTVGHVVIIYDLTEKNKMISELETAKIEAETASKAKENFLANISHEIRTPLNVVLGMNEMISTETDLNLIKEYSNNIEEAGKSLLNTINDVIDFSKIQSGELSIVNENYDLKETILNTTQLLKKKIEDKKLELIVDINENIPSVVNGDKMRIEQILLNLMDNALKFTSAGKIKVSVNCENIDNNNTNIILSVRDTGSGISKEDVDNLFTSFKKLEEDKNRTIGGTGLGLAITKKLVDAMKGSIKVESELEVGSLFKVTIPHKIVNDKNEITKKEENNTNEELDIPNISVLAVDDNSTNLLVFKGLLKKTNAKITTTTTGKEAIELFKNNKYDIVFLDHMMPEMDGVQVLNEIRNLEEDKEEKTPIIVLTANAVEGSKEEYLNYGFNDYLSKPVKGKSLKDIIKKYLIDDKDSKNNNELIECFNKLKTSDSLNTYISLLENLKQLSKNNNYKELSQRAHVNILKAKDNDIAYLKEHYIDLENEFNNIIKDTNN